MAISLNLTPHLVAPFANCNRPWNHHNTNVKNSTNAATVLAWNQRLKFVCNTFRRRRPRFECMALNDNDNEQEGRDLDDINQKASSSADSDENSIVNIETEQANIDASKVTTGSPLPGVKPPSEPVKIPKETLDVLTDQIFGFDTFFVTGQEPYEGGILFKGNLRGEATKSYTKLSKRLQERFGEQYKLFLLVNPEDDRPVAVVVPKESLQAEPTAVPEWFAASAFGLVTVFTILLRNAPALQLNLLSSFGNLGLLKEGLPGALITVAILGAHEIGHILVARKVGADLAVPYFVPSWQIGSFGAITRIKNALSNRKDLLQFAAAGPLAGFSLAFLILLAGFIFPPSNGQEVILDVSVFHESFLVGSIAKVILGDVLKEGAKVAVNPLVIWAWSGLLINAINSIPAGELDGGRISLALWGRKVWSRLTGASIALLGFSALFNDVAFYWVVLIIFLQRGPISPQSEEISQPDDNSVFLGIIVLVLGLLICLPFPFPFMSENML